MTLALSSQVPAWMAGGADESDIVLSSRIRLARNRSELPFPDRADEPAREEIIQNAAAQMPGLTAAVGKHFSLLKMAELSSAKRYVLVEKHLISPALADNPAGRAVLVSDDASISIMINEEDHFRIQAMRPGLDLIGALTLADQADDALEAGIDFAFDEEIGYLTACPTNVGAAVRASVMLHLPGLVISKQIERMAGAAAQVGLTVRGLYGEGSEAAGNLFQISNQLSLGYGERELVENLTAMVKQIADQERAARKRLLERSPIGLEDLVSRAVGILSYARRLDSNEALALASRVRLGADMGILQAPPTLFNELVVVTRPNYIQCFLAESNADETRCDVLRAQMVRRKMADCRLFPEAEGEREADGKTIDTIEKEGTKDV